jgi:hypothetical protein
VQYEKKLEQASCAPIISSTSDIEAHIGSLTNELNETQQLLYREKRDACSVQLYLKEDLEKKENDLKQVKIARYKYILLDIFV